MRPKTAFKISAAVATIIGLAVTWLNHLFGPEPITEESNWPDFMIWVGLVISSIGVLAYIAVDLFVDKLKSHIKASAMKEFSLKQVLILVIAIIAGMAFLETSAPIWSLNFLREFLLHLLPYGAASVVIVLALGRLMKGFTSNQLNILMVAIVTGISFIEASGPISSLNFWRMFGLRFIAYVTASVVIVLLIGEWVEKRH